MAKLALVYGVRLLPTDELESFEKRRLSSKTETPAGVTMHLIEGDSEAET